ncbi:MAG TPA: sigma-70 family RNA polymerase sigma factor [Candidatus Angelobacter sp.]|jgi:RNA polymerase sigma-70 factor (ECF subfamily)|nr:sigma-70 family RNA polymerase sigma factor [Candidatus Angelobacter sp.]
MDSSLSSFPLQTSNECFEALSSDTLIQRCATSDANAWYEFIRRFHPLIAGVIARTAMRWTTVSADLIDDLVQETYLKLCSEECRKLREFSSRHENSLFGFLKTVAYNVTMDHFKSRWAVKRGGGQFHDSGLDGALAAAEGPSLDHHILLQQLEQFIDRITGNRRDKLVFRLYYQQGFTSAAIAAIPAIGLSEKGVESCIHRLTGLLRNCVQKDRTWRTKSFIPYETPITELGN